MIQSKHTGKYRCCRCCFVLSGNPFEIDFFLFWYECCLVWLQQYGLATLLDRLHIFLFLCANWHNAVAMGGMRWVVLSLKLFLWIRQSDSGSSGRQNIEFTLGLANSNRRSVLVLSVFISNKTGFGFSVVG